VDHHFATLWIWFHAHRLLQQLQLNQRQSNRGIKRKIYIIPWRLIRKLSLASVLRSDLDHGLAAHRQTGQFKQDQPERGRGADQVRDENCTPRGLCTIRSCGMKERHGAQTSLSFHDPPQLKTNTIEDKFVLLDSCRMTLGNLCLHAIQ
jgi:hypothetical protein